MVRFSPEILTHPRFVKLGDRLSEWRNQKPTIGRKAVAEIGYAAVTVLGLAEAVAKAALAVLSATALTFFAPIWHLITNEKWHQRVEDMTELTGQISVNSGTSAWRCVVISIVMVSFLVKNLLSSDVPRNF